VARPRFHDIGTKLVALGLTLLVSGLVYLDQEHETTIEIPLEIVDLPPGLVPLDDVPAEVAVKVVARGRTIARMWLTRSRPEEMAIIVRVPEDAESIDRELTPADVSLALGSEMRVTQVVRPTRVSFRLDVLAERELAVAPRITGSPPTGFVVSGEVRVTPPFVTVSGPATLLEPLGQVPSESVSLAERRRPFNVAVAVVLPERLAATPGEVVVHADIEAERQYQLDQVRVVVRNARGLAHAVDPPEGTVTLLGPGSRISRLAELAEAGEPTGLVIAVDAAGRGPGAYEVTPVVELSDDLRLVAVEPPRFQLVLE
jgi:hypothetical protein